MPPWHPHTLSPFTRGAAPCCRRARRAGWATTGTQCRRGTLSGERATLGGGECAAVPLPLSAHAPHLTQSPHLTCCSAAGWRPMCRSGMLPWAPRRADTSFTRWAAWAAVRGVALTGRRRSSRAPLSSAGRIDGCTGAVTCRTRPWTPCLLEGMFRKARRFRLCNGPALRVVHNLLVLTCTPHRLFDSYNSLISLRSRICERGCNSWSSPRKGDQATHAAVHIRSPIGGMDADWTDSSEWGGASEGEKHSDGAGGGEALPAPTVGERQQADMLLRPDPPCAPALTAASAHILPSAVAPLLPPLSLPQPPPSQLLADAQHSKDGSEAGATEASTAAAMPPQLAEDPVPEPSMTTAAELSQLKQALLVPPLPDEAPDRSTTADANAVPPAVALLVPVVAGDGSANAADAPQRPSAVAAADGTAVELAALLAAPPSLPMPPPMPLQLLEKMQMGALPAGQGTAAAADSEDAAAGQPPAPSQPAAEPAALAGSAPASATQSQLHPLSLADRLLSAGEGDEAVDGRVEVEEEEDSRKEAGSQGLQLRAGAPDSSTATTDCMEAAAAALPQLTQQQQLLQQPQLALMAVPPPLPSSALLTPPLATFPVQQLQEVLGGGLTNMSHRLRTAAEREGALR